MILQQSRARFFLFSMLAEFFNSYDHCWSVVPGTRNTTHDPVFLIVLSLQTYQNAQEIKKNYYRPISILPLISKIFEKIMCRKLSNYFDNTLSKFHASFEVSWTTLVHYLLIVPICWRRKKLLCKLCWCYNPYFVANTAKEISENLPCLTKKNVFSVCKQSNDSKAKYRVR